MDSLNIALCEQEKLAENNSYRFVFREGSYEAVKAWAHHVEQLQLARQWYNTGEIKLLIDAREAVDLPIRYLFETLSDYNRNYPDLEAPHLSMAFLRTADTVIMDIYHMMAELFEPPLKVQFFLDEEKAERWLVG